MLFFSPRQDKINQLEKSIMNFRQISNEVLTEKKDDDKEVVILQPITKRYRLYLVDAEGKETAVAEYTTNDRKLLQITNFSKDGEIDSLIDKIVQY